MAVLVEDLTGVGMTRDRMCRGLETETFRDLASVEALWRSLESGPDAVATPYQRFDWVAAYVVGTQAAAALRIMVLRDSAGRPMALLPLLVSRVRGFSIARVVGAKHANYHMPLYASRRCAGIAAEELYAALAQAGRRAGIDAYALDHQPRFWDGIANPVAAMGTPCHSDAYGLMLGPDPEATVKRAFSAEARKKLRAKERKLVETHGPLEYRSATTATDRAAIVDAFYAQKQARFGARGSANPYADDGVRRFIAQATAGGETDPAIEVHALIAKDSGRILATFGGAVNDGRFSGIWTSFDPDPEIARFSPGDLLLHNLVGQQTGAGRRAFDLGVGKARYKTSICDETIELVEVLIPVSLRGHLFTLVAKAASGLGRGIRRSPRLRQAARWLKTRREVLSG